MPSSFIASLEFGDHRGPADDAFADLDGHLRIERQINLRAGAEADHAEAEALGHGIAEFRPRDDAPGDGARDLPDDEGGPALEGPCERLVELCTVGIAGIEKRAGISTGIMVGVDDLASDRGAIHMHVEYVEKNADAAALRFQYLGFFDLDDFIDDAIRRCNYDILIPGDLPIRIAEEVDAEENEQRHDEDRQPPAQPCAGGCGKNEHGKNVTAFVKSLESHRRAIVGWKVRASRQEVPIVMQRGWR